MSELLYALISRHHKAAFYKLKSGKSVFVSQGINSPIIGKLGGWEEVTSGAGNEGWEASKKVEIESGKEIAGDKAPWAPGRMAAGLA